MRKNASFFSSAVHRFFKKNRRKNHEKKRCKFSPQRCYFSTWRPSRNTVFYNTKATFSFSVFSYFFLNIVKKVFQNLSHVFPLKNFLKSRTRYPFWVPKWFQIHVGSVKKLENNPRKSFLDRAIFQTFFELQKALIRDGLEDPEPGWKGPDPENP